MIKAQENPPNIDISEELNIKRLKIYQKFTPSDSENQNLIDEFMKD